MYLLYCSLQGECLKEFLYLFTEWVDFVEAVLVTNDSVLKERNYGFHL